MNGTGNASTFVKSDDGNTFTHFVDGVERAFVPVSQLISYIANLAPALFAATAAAPQVDEVAAITKGLLSISQDVLGSIQDGSHPSVNQGYSAAPPPPPPAPVDLAAVTAAIQSNTTAQAQAVQAQTTEQRRAELEAQLAALGPVQ